MNNPMYPTVCAECAPGSVPASNAQIAMPGSFRGTKEASDLLERLFRSFDGSLALRLWNGTTLRLGRSRAAMPEPPFTLVCRSPSVVRAMVLGRDRLKPAAADAARDAGSRTVESERIDKPGEFFVREEIGISAADLVLLQAVARVLLNDSDGTLERPGST